MHDSTAITAKVRGGSRLFLLAGAALFIGFASQPAQGEPDWFKNPRKYYPADQYLIGTGVSQEQDKQERFNIAKETARAELIKVIRVDISSEFHNELVESQHGIDEVTQSRIVSNTDLEVDGIDVETKEEKRTVYTLAVLDKKEGRARHRAKVEQLNLELEQGWKQAQMQEQEDQREASLQTYLSLYPLLNRRDGALAVALALSDFSSAAFAAWSKSQEASPVQRAAVDQAIARLATGDFQSLDDAATALAFRLQQQLSPQQPLLVRPFTYGETPATSPFSRHLVGLLRDRLTRSGLAVVTPVRGETPQSANHAQSLAQQAGAEIMLRGGYLELPDGVRVFARAIDLTNGTQVAAAEVEIPLALVQAAGLTVKPQNFAQLMQDLGVFRADEMISGRLRVEVWTDRGSEDLLMEEGDEVALAVRVNQPSYLQMVYHLADRKRVLMYNNFYIDETKVNHAVALPDTFVVSEPFGTEFLQVFARTERFAEVPVLDWHGYPVLAEDLKDYVSQTRGWKKKARDQAEQAEVRLTVTTMAR